MAAYPDIPKTYGTRGITAPIAKTTAAISVTGRHPMTAEMGSASRRRNRPLTRMALPPQTHAVVAELSVVVVGAGV